MPKGPACLHCSCGRERDGSLVLYLFFVLSLSLLLSLVILFYFEFPLKLASFLLFLLFLLEFLLIDFGESECTRSFSSFLPPLQSNNLTLTFST